MLILVLICKNEHSVISSCLYSVKPYIDFWLIVDTGSSDATMPLIKEIMADKPGELHQREWVNFAHNRNQALQLAENIAAVNDYFLLMDADDQLVVSATAIWPSGQSHYLANFSLNNMNYTRPLLLRADAKWRYQGVVHEYLVSPRFSAAHGEVLRDIKVIARSAGARSNNPLRYLEDAKLLEAELVRNPEDTRSMFYLGQSYANHGDLERAIAAYSRRCEFPQGAPEVYNALYFIAELRLRRKDNWQDVQSAYLKAWRHSPHRAEPLVAIARYYYQQNNYELAVIYAMAASKLEIPDDLFVYHSAYTWEWQSILGLAHYHLQHFKFAWKYLNLAKLTINMPDKLKARVESALLDCSAQLNIFTTRQNVNLPANNGKISGKLQLG